MMGDECFVEGAKPKDPRTDGRTKDPRTDGRTEQKDPLFWTEGRTYDEKSKRSFAHCFFFLCVFHHHYYYSCLLALGAATAVVV